MTHEHRVSVTAVPECLDSIHDVVTAAVLAEPALSDRDRMRVETAVLEVAGNVVEHTPTAPGRDDVRLEVVAERRDGRLEVVLLDDGGPVDVDTDAAMPDWAAESGRGMPLAHALSDEFAYQRRDGRNHWRLAWRLDPPD